MKSGAEGAENFVAGGAYWLPFPFLSLNEGPPKGGGRGSWTHPPRPLKGALPRGEPTLGPWMPRWCCGVIEDTRPERGQRRTKPASDRDLEGRTGNGHRCGIWGIPPHPHLHRGHSSSSRTHVLTLCSLQFCNKGTANGAPTHGHPRLLVLLLVATRSLRRGRGAHEYLSRNASPDVVLFRPVGGCRSPQGPSARARPLRGGLGWVG